MSFNGMDRDVGEVQRNTTQLEAQIGSIAKNNCRRTKCSKSKITRCVKSVYARSLD
jgi:hypothetical protein